MGEAIFSLKAQFSTKKEAASVCADLKRFFKENDKVSDISWSRLQSIKSLEPLEPYPRVKEFLQIVGGSTKDVQSYGFENEEPYCIGNVLIYSANVGHLGSWDNLQKFITEKYKALKVVWGSDEYGGNLEALNLYAWEDIVQGILKYKKILPLLLGIHKDFDELISSNLKRKK